METRKCCLVDSVSWFQFSHEVAELHDWMNDIGKVVDSEDCGTDLEHAQMLLAKFEDFVRDVVSSEDRVISLHDMAQEVIEAGHSQAEVWIRMHLILIPILFARGKYFFVLIELYYSATYTVIAEVFFPSFYNPPLHV